MAPESGGERQKRSERPARADPAPAGPQRSEGAGRSPACRGRGRTQEGAPLTPAYGRPPATPPRSGDRSNQRRSRSQQEQAPRAEQTDQRRGTGLRAPGGNCRPRRNRARRPAASRSAAGPRSGAAPCPASAGSVRHQPRSIPTGRCGPPPPQKGYGRTGTGQPSGEGIPPNIINVIWFPGISPTQHG